MRGLIMCSALVPDWKIRGRRTSPPPARNYMPAKDLRLEGWPIAHLISRARNQRLHSEARVAQILAAEPRGVSADRRAR
jgi:hypothetical protein